MSEEHPSFKIQYNDLECELTPVARQEYSDCFFESGFVTGHPNDHLYLRYGRENEKPTIAMLRDDEVMAIVWVLTGTLWCDKLNTMETKT